MVVSPNVIGHDAEVCERANHWEALQTWLDHLIVLRGGRTAAAKNVFIKDPRVGPALIIIPDLRPETVEVRVKLTIKLFLRFGLHKLAVVDLIQAILENTLLDEVNDEAAGWRHYQCLDLFEVDVPAALLEVQRR